MKEYSTMLRREGLLFHLSLHGAGSFQVTNVKKSTKPTKTKTNPTKTREDSNLTKKKEENEKLIKTMAKTTPKQQKILKPSTLPSTSRASKTQFYPNKEVMYKNALLKQNEDKLKKERERNKTRTLSPSEVKVLKNEEPTSSNKRPGTATIKKPQIEKEETYESDFDSYESDFDEYLPSVSSKSSISSEDDFKEIQEEKIQIKENLIEEEKKLDSGNYEITESKHKQVLTNIIESEIENIKHNNNETISNLTSLSDEGFEEIKTEKIHFVNFLEAKRKNSLIKSAELKKKRGQDLLEMIHLDVQNFTIFELQPIHYEDFMKSFGNRNYIQTFVQTGDDNVDEETSTDVIETRTIWTQNPIKLSEENFNDIKLYHQDFLGVGFFKTDDLLNLKEDILSFNENNLKNFIENASEVILTLLEEKSQQNNCKEIENNDQSLPFSDGYISFNTNLDFLKNTQVTSATFSPNTTKILTVHNSIQTERTLLCLWKISDQNQPENIFCIYGLVICSSMDNNYIFAGLNDGMISIWSLNQLKSTLNNYNPPIYISDIQKGHNSKIISINPVEIENHDQNTNTQIYTLDEDGLLIIWSIIKLNSNNNLNLHINTSINFQETYNLKNLQCTDMCVNKLDPTQIFISTNYGNILHFITTGKKSHPKVYTNNTNNPSNCLISCPFSPLYFLCGCENGNVLLYSREMEKPLMVMSNKDGESSIDILQWSINKPCVFYAKDNKNVVHIWDLTKSDIFPIYSLKFKDNIDFVKLSPNFSQDNSIKRSYMVIVSGNKNVNLYVLNKEHGQQDKRDYEDNIKKFTNYVNRL